MKKVLFATTALVLSAGVAAAEVTVSGDGRMGIIYDGDKSNFNSRIRAIFKMSGETDGGLTFGGSFRADHVLSDSDEIGGRLGLTPVGKTAQNGGLGTIYLGGAFGKLTMGDTDGALENAVGDISGVGYTQPSGGFADARETEYLLASTGNNPHLLYSYEFGEFSIYASMTDGVLGGAQFLNGDDPARRGERAEGYSLGVTYAFGDFGVSAGYETLDVESYDSADQWAIGADVGFGDATLKGFYAQGSNVWGDDFQQYGASLDWTFGATTVTAFGRAFDYDDGPNSTYYGIGAAYSLGGGATLKAGLIKSDSEAGGSLWGNPGAADPSTPAYDEIAADFGVIFTF